MCPKNCQVFFSLHVSPRHTINYRVLSSIKSTEERESFAMIFMIIQTSPFFFLISHISITPVLVFTEDMCYTSTQFHDIFIIIIINRQEQQMKIMEHKICDQELREIKPE